jgi:hypothetical protein
MRNSSLILMVLLLLAACGGDSPTDPERSDSPDRLVIVGPYKVLVSEESASYRAFALYADGRPQQDVTDQVRWASDDEATFTVEGGRITILEGGLVHLRARLGDTEGKLNLLIVRRSVGIALPAVDGTEHLPTMGQSAPLTATMVFPGQEPVDVTSDVLWESSDPSVLRVDIHGVATAVGPGECFVTARYGTTPGTLPIVAGPMPDKTFDVTVVAIRLDADQFCENSDEGDAEFSYEFSITTSAGDRHILAATDDYPSFEDFELMADDEGTTGLLSIAGETSFVLSEIQSFVITARITEWDLTVYYFGDWFPDPEADDLTGSTIHRGSTGFDEGLHEMPLVGSAGCDLQFEYRVVVTER